MGLTDQEKQELLAYDKHIEQDKRDKELTEYDLSPEQEKIAKKYRSTGTRKTPEKKAPTVYNFPQKKFKSNATKEEVVAELAEFLANGASFTVVDLTVKNPTRLLHFKLGDKEYDLTLIQKSKPKK